jgi:hypothetical protein
MIIVLFSVVVVAVSLSLSIPRVTTQQLSLPCVHVIDSFSHLSETLYQDESRSLINTNNSKPKTQINRSRCRLPPQPLYCYFSVCNK